MKSQKNQLATLNSLLVVGLVFSYALSASAGRPAATAASGTSERSSPTIKSTGSPMDVRNSASQASGGQKSGQGLNMLMGGLMMAMGATDISTGISKNSETPGSGTKDIIQGAMEVVMGLQSFQQAGEHGKTAGLSDAAGAGFDYSTADAGSGSEGAGNFDVYGTPEWKKASAELAKLEKLGFKVDPKNGIISGKGMTVKASDLGSAASASAAGLPMDAYNSAMAAGQKASEKLAAKFSVSGIAVDEGGGGGSMAATNSDEDFDSGLSAPMASPDPSLANRDPASLSGMSTQYNGEPIGVKQDSIFAMVTRRYNLKCKQDFFMAETNCPTE